MEKKLSGFVVLLFVFFGAQLGATGNETKIELGKQLFNNPAFAMSTNKKSCNSCHPDGKGIGEIEKGDYTVMINRCIVGALKGQALEKDSEKMAAMQAYLMSLVQK